MKRVILFASVASVSLVSGTSYAQETFGAKAQESVEIDTIIVTANKRSEYINKVGMTITAISQEQLSERRISSLADIAAAVPGLSYAQSSYNTPILTLRGVGFNQQALGSYPAVSVYLDQAPLPFPVMAGHADYDLERIEVLKGPQGTLFGSNATGGALNFIAAKPTADFEGGGDISYGRFKSIGFNAYLSGPLADSVRARIAATGQQRDGWQISTSRPDDRNGESKYIAGRLLFDWDVSDSTRLSFNFNAWHDKSDPQTAQFVALNAQVGQATPGLLAYPFTPENPRASDWRPGSTNPEGNRKFIQAVVRMDTDLNDDVTLTTMTSYTRLKQIQTHLEDGTNLGNTGLAPDRSKLSSFNQEIRLTNDTASAIRWVVGGNYENSKTDSNQTLYFGGNTVFPAFGVFQSGARNSQRISNFAAFANVEYDIAPELTAKAGIRYTKSENNASFCAFDIGDGAINNLFTIISGVPLNVGDCGSLDSNVRPTITPLDIPLHEDNVSWRVGIDYKFDADGLVYANISRGYKAGSFPALAATSTLQYRPVTQESVTAYEAGVKKSLWNRRMHVNAALFYYDYQDKQVFGVLADPIFGPQAALVNVPKSRVFGVEGDVSIKPVAGLTLSGAVTYLQTRITEYTGFTPLLAVVDFKGSDLPFAPTWNYSLSADYRQPIAGGGVVNVGMSIQGNSGQDAVIGASDITITPVPNFVRVRPGLEHPYVTEGYATLDLRGGYMAPDGRWKIQLWGKNITNKYYWTNVVTAGDIAAARLAGMPATYGVTLGFNF